MERLLSTDPTPYQPCSKGIAGSRQVRTVWLLSVGLRKGAGRMPTWQDRQLRGWAPTHTCLNSAPSYVLFKQRGIFLL